MEKNTFLPNHVVIIPDGNRRWAKERGQEPWEGHEAGAKNTEALVRAARKLGIKTFSFWGSSLENLSKRPLAETQALLRIYAKHFQDLLTNEDIHKDRVRIRVIGRWREQFPKQLKATLEELEKATESYDQYSLNFFLAYSGDDEMRQAVERLIAEHKSGIAITDADIKGALMTRDLPPVDLLVRTGGEPHLSAGFMMWDIANAQLFFSEKLYPDFGPEDLEEAVLEYVWRERRLGK
ncbi:MAG: di-trans,poly-cis-decaprenylcistransferase [Candidatus Moranbacteria bacterium RIFCSPHIGHO2_01_FULL_55_24]|nr:MAG: di-trans,poly-cis-decaprenylcistransferase [Candidatus Moranbacteria bacterium RIFCSPHIGHO2_01_FULL_55_24]